MPTPPGICQLCRRPIDNHSFVAWRPSKKTMICPDATYICVGGCGLERNWTKEKQ